MFTLKSVQLNFETLFLFSSLRKIKYTQTQILFDEIEAFELGKKRRIQRMQLSHQVMMKLMDWL